MCLQKNAKNSNKMWKKKHLCWLHLWHENSFMQNYKQKLATNHVEQNMETWQDKIQTINNKRNKQQLKRKLVTMTEGRHRRT